MHRSVVRHHDAVQHRQPQPRPFADRLGGEEGLEDALPHRVRHAGASVTHQQAHIQARHQVRMARRVLAVVQVHCLHGHAQHAAIGGAHGMFGVAAQVQQQLLHLRRVAVDPGVAAAHLHQQLHRGRDGRAQQRLRVGDQRGEVDARMDGQCAAREKQDLLHDVARTVAGVHHRRE